MLVEKSASSVPLECGFRRNRWKMKISTQQLRPGASTRRVGALLPPTGRPEPLPCPFLSVPAGFRQEDGAIQPKRTEREMMLQRWATFWDLQLLQIPQPGGTQKSRTSWFLSDAAEASQLGHPSGHLTDVELFVGIKLSQSLKD